MLVFFYFSRRISNSGIADTSVCIFKNFNTYSKITIQKSNFYFTYFPGSMSAHFPIISPAVIVPDLVNYCRSDG